MNTKWQIITPTMVIIITICAGFIFFFIRDNQKTLEGHISLHIEQVRSVARVILDQNSNKYQKRMESFLNYQASPQRSLLLKAFAIRDREKVLQLTTPIFKLFKNEDPYFSTLTWILPDNVSFLHMHKPAKPSVDVSQWRPDIVAANKEHGQYTGFSVSSVGLQQRFVNSVNYEGQHLGVLHFGLQDSQLLDALHKQLKIPVGLLIPNENYQRIQYSKIPALEKPDFTIQSYQQNVFKEMFDRIDWTLETQRISIGDKHFFVVRTLSLNNYLQKSQGYIVVVLDITPWINAVRLNVIKIIFASLLAIQFSSLILNLSLIHNRRCRRIG
jgi:hypothetical protein